MAETNTTEVMEYSKEDKQKYNRLVGYISKEYGKVEGSTLNIAFALHQIYTEKMYSIDGYKNIYEFGDDRFNLARGTVNNFINVIEKFAKRDDSGNLITGKDGQLDEKFEKFTWSKLCQLVSVPTEYLDEFYSTMTCKEIRDMKKDIANRINSVDSSELIEAEDFPMNTSEESSADDILETDEEDNNVIHEMFLSVASFKKTDKSLSEVFNVDELCKALLERWIQFEKTIPTGATPTVEFGMIIR